MRDENHLLCPRRSVADRSWHSLVKVFDTQPGAPADDVSWADFIDLTAQQDVFERVAGDDGMAFRLRVGDGPLEAVGGAVVTAAWLDTLGVKPRLGRGFLLDDQPITIIGVLPPNVPV